MESLSNDSVENILLHLINGRDPKTGILIKEGSPVLEEKVKQALNSALVAVKSYREHKVRIMNLPANTGKPWTKEEDQRLVMDFDRGLTLNQLAKAMLRTRGAITARLIKLGKISESNY